MISFQHDRSTYSFSSGYLRNKHILQYSNDPTTSYLFSSSYLKNKNILQQQHTAPSTVSSTLDYEQHSVKKKSDSQLSYPVIDLPEDQPSSLIKNLSFSFHSSESKFHSLNHDKASNPSTLSIKQQPKISIKNIDDGINYDYQFRKLIKTELFHYAQSYKNNDVLKTKFSLSLDKKLEAENILISEIQTLRPLLISEYEILDKTYLSMQQNLNFYKHILNTKMTDIETMKVVLTDMNKLRVRIREKDILQTMDITINKNQKLLQIELELTDILKKTFGSYFHI